MISAEIDDKEFFILPDIGSKIADLEQSGKSEKEILKEKYGSEDTQTDHRQF